MAKRGCVIKKWNIIGKNKIKKIVNIGFRWWKHIIIIKKGIIKRNWIIRVVLGRVILEITGFKIRRV